MKEILNMKLIYQPEIMAEENFVENIQNQSQHCNVHTSFILRASFF